MPVKYKHAVASMAPATSGDILASATAKKPEILVENFGEYTHIIMNMMKHKMFPISLLDDAAVKPAPLIDAHGLYAPVHGTGAGSRYFLVGAFDGFNVAARYKGNKLSIRVEGAVPTAVSSALGSMSFSSTGKHWSQHMMASDVECSRYLGAVFGAVVAAGATLYTPLPDVKFIAGKGV
jgi:hypothetical protein